jgi:hypothetical protein
MVRSSEPDGHYNARVEALVAAHGGKKSLYSCSSYDEATFWQEYNRDTFDTLKAECDREGRDEARHLLPAAALHAQIDEEGFDGLRGAADHPGADERSDHPLQPWRQGVGGDGTAEKDDEARDQHPVPPEDTRAHQPRVQGEGGDDQRRQDPEGRDMPALVDGIGGGRSTERQLVAHARSPRGTTRPA